MLDNRVLIIEDEAEVSELLATAVEVTLGCQVVTASNGEVGLKEALKNVPDLILLDWLMPKKSGLEVLEALRANAATKHVPIHMITQKTSINDVKVARDAGADGYFLKPVDFEKFCVWLAEKFPVLAESRRAEA